MKRRWMRQRKKAESNGHQSSEEAGNQDTKKRNSSQPVFAMSWEGFAEKQRGDKTHVHGQQTPSLSEALFGRIAAMQDLYIGGTGTTANRPSSRANFATATTPSPPGTAATTNGVTASCLEQNGRFH